MRSAHYNLLEPLVTSSKYLSVSDQQSRPKRCLIYFTVKQETAVTLTGHVTAKTQQCFSFTLSSYKANTADFHKVIYDIRDC